MILQDIPAREGISVLYGHRILPAIPTGLTPYAHTTVSYEYFNRFLQAYDHWQALSIHDLKAGNYHPDTPAYVLTFDDGYRDNMLYLLPMLEYYDVPAAIFLCHDFCYNGLEPFEQDFASRLNETQGDIYEAEREQLKRGSFANRQKKLQSLITKYDLQSPPTKTDFLDEEDIKLLNDHPLITLGHHTKTHPNLAHLNPFALNRELASPYDTIAYPYGGHNVLVRTMAQFMGYQMGFTTENALYHPDKHSLLAIPRIKLSMD